MVNTYIHTIIEIKLNFAQFQSSKFLWTHNHAHCMLYHPYFMGLISKTSHLPIPKFIPHISTERISLIYLIAPWYKRNPGQVRAIHDEDVMLKYFDDITKASPAKAQLKIMYALPRKPLPLVKLHFDVYQ